MTVVAERPVTSPPYGAYAAITGVFLGGLGVVGVAARALDRDPACQTGLDLIVLSAASFKAARRQPLWPSHRSCRRDSVACSRGRWPPPV